MGAFERAASRVAAPRALSHILRSARAAVRLVSIVQGRRQPLEIPAANAAALMPPAIRPAAQESWLLTWPLGPGFAVAMSLVFGVWYGSVLLDLPLFGDAANHARIARHMIQRGPWGTISDYPPMYHLAAGFALKAGGEQGFVGVTLVGTVALGIAVYFFAREVAGSNWIAASAALIAFLAPKTWFYAGRLYMEIPLSALIVAAMVFLHRYLRLRTRRDLIVSGVLVGLTCITKQQGMFLLAPSLVFLFGEGVWTWCRRQAPLAHALREPAIFAAISIALFLPAAFWMLRSTGRLLPDTEFTSAVNHAAATLAGYEEPALSEEAQLWDTRLDQEFSESGLLERGSQMAEARHVWPQDVLTPVGFFKIHSPYGEWRPLVRSWRTGLQLLLVVGLVVWGWKPRSRAFTVFFALYLLTNYVTFVRTNDQQRYYLYFAYLCAFAIPLAVDRLARRFGSRAHLAAAAALSLTVLMQANSDLPGQLKTIRWYGHSQAYAPSAGGVASVKEASQFLNANLAPDERFYAVPTTEFGYYADREGIFDFRIYFLRLDELIRYFEDLGVKYVVIPDSAVVPDSKWSHLVKAPRSFVQKVGAVYPAAYTTSAHDIRVYRVVPASQIGSLPDLDLTEPRAAVMQPADGSAASGPVPILGIASDDRAVTNVLFYIDGKYGRGLAGPREEYVWIWDSTSVPNGEHTISIKAVDESGNYAATFIRVDIRN